LISKIKHKFVVTCFAVGMLLFSYVRVSADEIKEDKSAVDIEADSMDYDYSSDKYHAQGKVVITYSDIILNADDVELDNKNKIATAQGKALLKMGEDTLRGDKIVFNIESKTGVAYKGQAFYARNHFYVRGDKIEKTGENTYFIEQPKATTCDGASPDWEIAGSEMDVTINGYGLMKNARFLTKGLPIFYSPIVPFPAKTKRQSGFLLPDISYSRQKDGLDIEVPFFWAISPQVDATFYQRYIEKRGFKEGAEFRYYLGDHSFGTLYGDFMEDRKNITEKINIETDRDWEGMHRRWSYYLNHQTNFDSNFYARTDLRKVSDKWYFKDFAAHNYYLDHYAINDEDPFKKVPFYGNESVRSLESTARVYKGWSNYNLMGLVSYTDDFAKANNESTLQKYPEIVLTGIKQPFLATPLYYELTGTYDNYYRGEGQKGHLFDFNPSISLPINLAGYAKITPQFAFKETAWIREDNSALGDKKDGNRAIYTASVNLSSQIARIFNFNAINWEKIRHEIKPELSYVYTPNVSQDNIPDYMPLIKEQNAVIWALTNTLTAKVKDEKQGNTYLEFLRLKLFQTYDINEAKRNKEDIDPPKRPLSDMGIELDLNPHKYLSFAARNQYNVYSGWKEMNYDLNIKDWRGDQLTVGYRYTIDSIEQINLNLKAMITNSIAAKYILRQDQFNSSTIESTVGLIYLSQCWSLGLDFSRTPGDYRFLLTISLAGLGKL
jgi:LPS-assembly protein